jgi:hypothetical protein
MHGVVASLRRDGALRRVVALVAAVLAAALAVGAPVASANPPGDAGPMTQVFGDEFNGNGLNTAVWTPGWMANSANSGPFGLEANGGGGAKTGHGGACFSNSNVSQPGDGRLHLKLTVADSQCGALHPTETGAAVESRPGDGVPGHSGFAYTYGYVEWYAMMPQGVSSECPSPPFCIGTTPQLWTMSIMPGSDLNLHDAEIDTMEGYHGNACPNTHGFYHSGTGNPWTNPPDPGQCRPGSTLNNTWHTYGALWTSSGVRFYYDGQYIGLQTPWITLAPSPGQDKPEFLAMDIVNFTDWIQSQNKDLQIDWVKVWQKDSDGDGLSDWSSTARATDACPNSPGPLATNGCTVETPAYMSVIAPVAGGGRIGYVQSKPFTPSGWVAQINSPGVMRLATKTNGTTVMVATSDPDGNGAGPSYWQQSPFGPANWVINANNISDLQLTTNVAGGQTLVGIDPSVHVGYSEDQLQPTWGAIVNSPTHMHVTSPASGGSIVAMVDANTKIGYWEGSPFTPSGWAAVANNVGDFAMMSPHSGLPVLAMFDATTHIAYAQTYPFNPTKWNAIANDVQEIVLARAGDGSPRVAIRQSDGSVWQETGSFNPSGWTNVAPASMKISQVALSGDTIAVIRDAGGGNHVAAFKKEPFTTSPWVDVANNAQDIQLSQGTP